MQKEDLIDIPNYSEDEDEEKVNLRALTDEMDNACMLTGWDELLLKQELRRALRQARFDRPSKVQGQALPRVINGQNLICQAKSGTGKTAVFVLSILHNLLKTDGQYRKFSTLVLVHTRQLAHQIFTEFERMKKYFQNPQIVTACFFGGINIQMNIEQIQEGPPINIIIGTPGRLVELVRKNYLKLNQIQFFVVDECDNILKNGQMRKDLVYLFKETPHEKQMMMFSATLSESDKKDAKNFMDNPAEVYIDEDMLNFHNLTQYYVEIEQTKKIKKLLSILDKHPFNQAIIFVNKVQRVVRLANLLHAKFCNPFQIHSKLSQEERIKTYDAFKRNQRKILVASDLFGRGIDIPRVNLVINFDFPYDKETYLHRIGRAGRYNTKGVAINFINPDIQKCPYERVQPQTEVLEEVRKSYKVEIGVLPIEMQYPLAK